MSCLRVFPLMKEGLYPSISSAFPIISAYFSKSFAFQKFVMTTIVSSLYYPVVLGVFEKIFADVLITENMIMNTLEQLEHKCCNRQRRYCKDGQTLHSLIKPNVKPKITVENKYYELEIKSRYPWRYRYGWTEIYQFA